jgi:hypothetical protein
MNEIVTRSDGDSGDLLAEIARTTQSPALRIMLDEVLFEKAKAMAHYMAGAKGFIPKHLEGNTHACFAVVVRAITWKMDPYAVAAGTYQTPGGQVGYEGKLIQAVVENSGKLDPAYGGLRPEYFGDWSKVQARFTMKTSAKGNQYPAPGWTPADEEGLGVIVTGKIKGEAEPRELRFLLKQAFPRNSTLWATDPETQLWYTAVRRFANVRMPGLLLGLPDEGGPEYGQMIDVTPQPAEPRPTRASVRSKAAERQKPDEIVYPLVDYAGRVIANIASPNEWIEAYGDLYRGADATGRRSVEEHNDAVWGQIIGGGLVPNAAATRDDIHADDSPIGDAPSDEIAEDPPVFEIVDHEGEVRQYEHPSEALDEYSARLAKLARPGAGDIVRGFMETNADTIRTIIDEGLVEDAASIVMQVQQQAIAATEPKKAEPAQQPAQQAGQQAGQQPAQQRQSDGPDDEPPPPASADDYGDNGGRQPASQQAGDDDWLVPYPANAKNSTGMVGYMRDLKAKLATCQHKGHVQQFNRANRKNMVEAAAKFRLAQMHELVTQVDERLR